KALSVIGVVFLASTGLAAAASAPENPSDPIAAAIEAATALPLPKVLSAADAARYAEIFALQEDGKWKEADALIDALESDILMGYVQSQRYLHPTAYRSSYDELKRWMAYYADHPQASDIYELALK